MAIIIISVGVVFVVFGIAMIVVGTLLIRK